MGIIKLETIRVFAYHGCLDEEAKIGSDYLVNLQITTNLLPSAISDNLTDTIDYVTLHKIVVDEMDIRAKLLEHVAYRIITKIHQQLPNVNHTKVAVTKVNPPIGGDVAGVTIVMETPN